jgi:uncharacterized membrane protein
MITRLATVWESVRSSLWALPLLIVCGGCALAYAALSANTGAGRPIWVLFGGSSQQAPDFLSSLMTAMINMATLAISITMVVLALAAQQLGPRLIRSFMSDRRTQIALGLFVGTVVYLVLVLRSAYGDGKTVPNIAVTGGTVLVLISLITLVLFVHHLAHSIVADNVIERVGAQFDRDILRLCPEENDAPPANPDLGGDRAPILMCNGGYVQAIDYGSVARAAAEAGAVVAFEVRAGHHAVTGVVAAYVSPKHAINDELRQAIQSAVLVGAERTTVQDLEYSARHLVEVALRALSPGINDVYTALAVINRLALSLRTIMQRAAPQSVWKDEDGHVRVFAPVSTFDGVTDAAFNQIRQNASDKPAILIRMAESIGQLLQQANDDQRAVLEKHLHLVLNEGRRSIPEKQDLHDLEERVKAASADTGRASGRHART